MSELGVQGGPAPITPLGTWGGPAINNLALAGDGKTLGIVVPNSPEVGSYLTDPPG